MALRRFLLTLCALAATAPAAGEPGRTTEARTLVLTGPAVVRDEPAGAPVTEWRRGRLVTSNRTAGEWVRATGHFPDGEWAPLEGPHWLHASALEVRDAPLPPRTWRLRVAAPPLPDDGTLPPAELARDTLVTGRAHGDGRVRITGHFPDGDWAPLASAAWLPRAAVEDVDAPPTYPRPDGFERWIRVDKDQFRLEVRERTPAGEEYTLYTTEVGLGMDRCLPEEQGGRCYFTEPGEYEVRWKIHRADGIEWCIPESMAEEPEYREHIRQGERCFEGALGKLALNIGGPYAIHGTNKPEESLGQQVSHGCIRTANEAMDRIWRYVAEGDRVVITE
ncbi:MAG: L,D-transpeptidase [Pseudomonadota bacterium]